jgi:glycosyltransferase involved in cell wall biosynthesis
MLRKRDIVMIASSPWKIDGKLNCHHLAERLAEQNRVVFVESPGLRAPSMRHGSDWGKVLARSRNWLSELTEGPRRITERLFVASPAIIPWHESPLSRRLNRIVFGSAVNRVAAILGFRDPIYWVFLPTSIYAIEVATEAPVIYHCTDDYAGNVGVNTTAVRELEDLLLSRAAIVFATSRPLADRIAKRHCNVHCVPNVAEIERFTNRFETPTELASMKRPIVGYVGNVASFKVDTMLVSQLAAARPQWSFVFVGPIGSGDPSTDLSDLQQPNIHLLGSRAYEAIPDYVHAFDVSIIPFARNQVTDGSLPLKTFEYLAAGTPVVSTPIPSLKAEPLDDVISYADDAESFASAIEYELRNNDESARTARMAVAQRYSWSVRYPEIAKAVSDVLGNGK